LLRNWLFKRLEARAIARKDAAGLLRDYGDRAYEVARTRAREMRNTKTIDADRDERHWDRVRGVLARRMKRSRTDTATRMLDDRR